LLSLEVDDFDFAEIRGYDVIIKIDGIFKNLCFSFRDVFVKLKNLL
jgi:hypothetical protein